MDNFYNTDELNEEQANFIKNLRVNEGYTWRAIASEYSRKYMDEPSGNQLLGLELCTAAMKFLGEKVEDGWN
jgi:hypothetical protein